MAPFYITTQHIQFYSIHLVDTVLFLKQLSQDEQTNIEMHTLIPLTHPQCGIFLSLEPQKAVKRRQKRKIMHDLKILMSDVPYCHRCNISLFLVSFHDIFYTQLNQINLFKFQCTSYIIYIVR